MLMSTSRYSFKRVHALDNDEIRKLAPSVFAEAAHDSRSERYTYIPTIQILDRLRKEGFEPVMATQANTRDETRREFTKHMIRLRQVGALTTLGAESNEVILINSHDGTSAYQMHAGVFRVVCNNGLVVGKMREEVRIPHKGNVVDNVIEGAFRVVEEFELVDAQRDGMKAIQLNHLERSAFAESALMLKYDPIENPAPIDHTKLLTTHRHEDNATDLWTTFNVAQENLIRGGLRGRTANRRPTTTREVKGIDQNVKLNRALWSLAEKMRELKS